MEEGRKKAHPCPSDTAKRGRGAYFTAGNPFDNRAFKGWAKSAGLPRARILEPFAGANSLIDRLGEMDLCNEFKSYDIVPSAKDVIKRDTLSRFPKGFDVCITNPPWLAKNSATARGLPFPDTHYDDLYKFALQKCLDNCGWVGALVPESYIRANLFHERLRHFVSLTGAMFEETGHPVGLALFHPMDEGGFKHRKLHADAVVWRNNHRIGKLRDLLKHKPVATDKTRVRFNDPRGNVGLRALDDTESASIRFCDVRELQDYQVKESSRGITKLTVAGKIKIDEWNEFLNDFRQNTMDVLLTCFKGIRKDGMYRRRLDWDTARGIIEHAG